MAGLLEKIFWFVGGVFVTCHFCIVGLVEGGDLEKG